MEMLKRLWLWKPAEEKRRSAASAGLRGLFLFLAFMVCFTLVSRAADAITVAQVSAEAPKRMALTHDVVAEGKLEATGEVAVSVSSGMLVQSVDVTLGQTVQEGDLLFSYDIKDLQDALYQEQLEANKLQLELESIIARQQTGLEKGETALSRAEEDLAYVKKNAQRLIQAASDEVDRARKNLWDYRDYTNSDDYEEDDDVSDTQLQQLRDIYEGKRQSLRQVKAEQEKAVLDAERAVEDAVTQPEDTDIELKKMDLAVKQSAMRSKAAAVASGGKAYAATTGIVTRINVSEGARTPDEAALFISSQGVCFKANISEDEKKYVNSGAPVTLTFSDDRKMPKDLKVQSIERDTGESGGYKIVVPLPDDFGEPGLAGRVKVSQRTETFDICVPLSAVYSEGEQKYIFVVNQKDTTLGVSKVAKRVDVDLLDSNANHAAVTGALSGDDLIIKESDRILSAGERIRLK